MTLATEKPVECGANDCGLPMGQSEIDAGMAFIRCPTCKVLRIPNANIVRHTVLPDPPCRLSLAMRVLMSLRILWLGIEFPVFRDKSIQILDAGCGDGQFLEFLKGRGYEYIVGIEPDPDRLRNALLRKVAVYERIATAEHRRGQSLAADVIIVWQVLEHVPRPADFLCDYAACLKPGGVMIVSVPNQHSVQTRLFGYFSAYPDYGRHLWYHDRSYVLWIEKVLPEFKVSVLPNINFEYEIFAWIDSIVSAALRRQNAVHKSLKKGDGTHFFRITMALAAVVLLPLAVLLSCVSLVSGCGSTLTFVARRASG